ncbi:MAG: hypothetical protein A2Z21_04575 [Candidatus Fraserbacteria bacterium RBG_16_55_9]|uniref:DUF5615 domain-containing protein n=1 Tax=Fraserbacteria sp. (strain RBG_16_55_9) TaxID=1817864 RepID=A0A1F5UV94_FRAXR|nr:MAG: hypothetical protein A2Z21_04575 [Candidatus Fraserbacteria bacterium RBG_16_55_9]
MAQYLADENVFTDTVRLMRNLGLNVKRVQELSLTGAKDPEIFHKAQELSAVLVTNDQDFGDIRAYPPSSHQGVVVLKMDPNPKKVEAVHQVLRELLKKEHQFERCLFIVDTHKYRKRTKP